MGKSEAGKGDSLRPKFVSDRQYELNWMLAFGEITPEEYQQQIALEKASKGDCHGV